MLYFLALVLLAIWVIALAFKVTVWAIHIALVAAIVLLILALVRGRRPASPLP